MTTPRNWFDSGGADYARFRPGYPRALAEHLLALRRTDGAVVDLGCGSGQLTTLLADTGLLADTAVTTGDEASPVLGVDPSAAQLADAGRHPRVRYVCGAAERLPLAAGSVGLLAAAQAAHWFEPAAFHAEVRRVCVPGGVLALVTYGVPTLSSPTHAPGADAGAGADEAFRSWYRDELAPFWPPERRHVDSGYRTLDFPYEELPDPGLRKVAELALDDFLGYLSTWSAVRRASETGHRGVLDRVVPRLAAEWPEGGRLRVTWPLTVRAGVVAG